MVNSTVNNKKKISEGAAGKADRTKIVGASWQNNRPQELEIEVTNSGQMANIPFIVDRGDIIKESDKVVVIKCKPDTREDVEKRKQNKISTISEESR